MKKRGIILILAIFISVLFVMSAAQAADRLRSVKAVDYRDSLIQEYYNGGEPVYDKPDVYNEAWSVYNIRPDYAENYGPDLTQSNQPAIGGQLLRTSSYDRFVSIIQDRYKRSQQGLGTPFFMNRYPNNQVYATYYITPQNKNLVRGSSVVVPGTYNLLDAPVYGRYKPDYYWIDALGEEMYTPQSNIVYGGKVLTDPEGQFQGATNQGLRDYRDYEPKF